jgi:hypothetical protein
MRATGQARRPMTPLGWPSSSVRTASCAGPTRSQERVGFLRGGARPPLPLIVAYIDQHKFAHGVEPICRVLTEAGAKIAPSTYYATTSRPPSARSVTDVATIQVIERVHSDNYGVYGVRKMHAELRRQGPRWPAAPLPG